MATLEIINEVSEHMEVDDPETASSNSSTQNLVQDTRFQPLFMPNNSLEDIDIDAEETDESVFSNFDFGSSLDEYIAGFNCAPQSPTVDILDPVVNDDVDETASENTIAVATDSISTVSTTDNPSTPFDSFMYDNPTDTNSSVFSTSDTKTEKMIVSTTTPNANQIVADTPLRNSTVHIKQEKFGIQRPPNFAQLLLCENQIGINEKLVKLCKTEESRLYEKDPHEVSIYDTAYTTIIKNNQYFKEMEKVSKLFIDNVRAKTVNDTVILYKNIRRIVPNDVRFKHINPRLENDQDWVYELNPKQDSEILPMRWCGKDANFYQPLVIRYKNCDSGRKITHMGLCPYCTVSEEDVKDNFNRLFHPLSGRKYEAHVGLAHGVYRSGHEMKPPVVANKAENLYYSCLDCQIAKKMDLQWISRTDLVIIEYFKHCLFRHSSNRGDPSQNTEHNPRCITGSSTAF